MWVIESGMCNGQDGVLETCLPNLFPSFLHPGRHSVVGPGHRASSCRGGLVFMNAHKYVKELWVITPLLENSARKESMYVLESWYLGDDYFRWTYTCLEYPDGDTEHWNSIPAPTCTRFHQLFRSCWNVLSSWGWTDVLPRFPLAGNCIFLCWLAHGY